MTTAIRATTAAKATGVSAATRIAAAVLLGALALSGCERGGSGDTGGAGATPGATASTTGGDDGGAGDSAADDDGVDGSWLATTGGRAVALIVNGKQAALFSTGRTICTGTTAEEGARHVIRLDACKSRTTGTVDSVNRTTLRVTWEGGLGTETYTRSTGGALPSGLPTASLGS
ncbi:hypothetical protein [Streptomyces sp. CB01373]|uniref:hypothetical protein n=1 Tax=Streptomyces sp. CB01373 TaxID=2020325 RepID=UPI000C271AE7|nr:hypothetical protein [Streptomyces sp. CB01373]PJM95710.1 hypothetical protein CG719_11610 [Streptomyces sp. CB01373]